MQILTNTIAYIVKKAYPNYYCIVATNENKTESSVMQILTNTNAYECIHQYT